jgi:hypothetical protein
MRLGSRFGLHRFFRRRRRFRKTDVDQALHQFGGPRHVDAQPAQQDYAERHLN